jgi:hypothetical protein
MHRTHDVTHVHLIKRHQRQTQARMPLHKHVYIARVNIHLIQTLLDLGADVSATDAQGETGMRRGSKRGVREP